MPTHRLTGGDTLWIAAWSLLMAWIIGTWLESPPLMIFFAYFPATGLVVGGLLSLVRANHVRALLIVALVAVTLTVMMGAALGIGQSP